MEKLIGLVGAVIFVVFLIWNNFIWRRQGEDTPWNQAGIRGKLFILAFILGLVIVIIGVILGKEVLHMNWPDGGRLA